MQQNTALIRSYAEIEEIEQQEFTLEFQSTYDIFAQSAQKFAQAPALSLMLQATNFKCLQTFNYQQLFAHITQTANLFYRLGVKKDTVIALILPNLAQTHFCLWGAEAVGIVMPINPLLEPEALIGLLSEAKAEIIVTLAPFPKIDLWQKVAQILPELPDLRHLLLVDLAHQVMGIKGNIAKLLQKKHEFSLYGYKGLKRSIPAHIQTHRYTQALAQENANELNFQPAFNAQNKSSFFCTGGTTGLPKIAMRTHANEISNCQQIRNMFGAQTIHKNTTVLCGLPLFHVNPVLATGLYPFMQGAHVILASPQGFRGEGVISHFWKIVETHKINFFAAVPTVYSALLNNPAKPQNVSSLEFGICGAAPMPVQVFKDFEALTGIKILEGYGLTEATCVSSVNPPHGQRKIGSIGMRLPAQKMQVVTPLFNTEKQSTTFEICKPNCKGLLVIQGDNVFSGYKIDAQNKQLWLIDEQGQRWLNTGDLAYQDEDGYFYLTGREKEMIIRGGHNIDPKSIEEVMYTHPQVAFAAAIGKPDSYAGELPILYIEPKANANISQIELEHFAAQHISEQAAIPKEVHLINSMPLTTVGKVYKPELKKQAIIASFSAALDTAQIKAEVRVEQDPVYGLVTQVEVADKQQLGQANNTLGVFAIRYNIY